MEKIKCNCAVCTKEFDCDGEYCFSEDLNKHLCSNCKEQYEKGKREAEMIEEDMKIWRKTIKFK